MLTDKEETLFKNREHCFLDTFFQSQFHRNNPSLEQDITDSETIFALSYCSQQLFPLTNDSFDETSFWEIGFYT